MAKEEDEHEQPSAQPEQHALHKTSVWEWLVAGIGLVLVVGAIGYLVYQAVTDDTSPPDIRVRLTSVTAVPDGYLATIMVENRGGSTAAALLVEGEIKNGADSLETSQATFDYLPDKSEREAGLFFEHDPRQFDLQVRAKGYEKP